MRTATGERCAHTTNPFSRGSGARIGHARGSGIADQLGETVALTPQEVARLAALARLELTESECAELAPELEVILGSVARVGEVAGDDVPLMTHALPLTNVMRPDRVRESLPQQAVLAGAPDVEDERFRVPRILSED